MKRLSMIIACTLCFVMTANANVINEPAVTETQDGVLLNISGTVEIADRNADTDNIVFLQINRTKRQCFCRFIYSEYDAMLCSNVRSFQN